MRWLTFLLLLAPCALSAQDIDKVDKGQIVYVPTDQAVVEKMLDMAKVTKDDVVFDLGCGDGRVVCTAAKKYGCKGVGIDIDPDRIKDSLRTMKKFEVTAEQVEIRQGDALRVKDLERATVVFFYMLPEFMEKLEPQLKRLKPGTRLVAHDYPFPNTEPDQVVEFKTPGANASERPRFLYLWTIREKKK